MAVEVGVAVVDQQVVVAGPAKLSGGDAGELVAVEVVDAGVHLDEQAAVVVGDDEVSVVVDLVIDVVAGSTGGVFECDLDRQTRRGRRGSLGPLRPGRLISHRSIAPQARSTAPAGHGPPTSGSTPAACIIRWAGRSRSGSVRRVRRLIVLLPLAFQLGSAPGRSQAR